MKPPRRVAGVVARMAWLSHRNKGRAAQFQERWGERRDEVGIGNCKNEMVASGRVFHGRCRREWKEANRAKMTQE